MRATPIQSRSRPDEPATASGNSSLLTLERRLEEGYARIEEAIVRGEDVASWESFWIDLLHRYEAECDALPEAA